MTPLAWLLPIALPPAWWPAAALVVCASLVVRRRRGRRDRAADPDREVDVFGRLVAIGLSGGLPPAEAVRMAATSVDRAVATGVDAVLRQAATSGLAAAMSGSVGPASPVLRRLAAAQVSGGSPGAAVLALVDERQAERRARLLSRVRALPVLLSLPVALALLPGFLLVVVGPAVADRAGSLLGPLIGP